MQAQLGRVQLLHLVGHPVLMNFVGVLLVLVVALLHLPIGLTPHVLAAALLPFLSYGRLQPTRQETR